MGDPQQIPDSNSDDCNTAILTPISNSPSTPADRGTKRKFDIFEEEPPALQLPQPLITPPEQAPSPRPQMFFIDALLRVFSTLAGYAGYQPHDAPATPVGEPHATDQVEVSPTVADGIPHELTKTNPTPPDTPTYRADAEIPVPAEITDGQSRKPKTLPLHRQKELALLLFRRTARQRDAKLGIGRTDTFQNRRRRENRARIDNSTGSFLSVSQRQSDTYSTPRPKRDNRRRITKVPDTPSTNPKIEIARRNAKRDESLLQAYIDLEEKEASLNSFIGLLAGTDNFKSYETVKKERAQREAEIQRLKEISRKPKEPIVKPLSKATLSEVEKVLAERDPLQPVIEKFRVTIHARDVQTLRERTWLNDEIVNFYLNMVCERANMGASGKVKVFAFNSFFYKKLSEDGYKSVERWSRRGKIDGDNLLKLDYLIIPVHLTYHWTLGVVNFKKKRVEYFDSLGGGGGQFYKHIRSYLTNESRKKINLEEWVDYTMKGAPMQENGYDCGVFLCKTAEVVCRGLDPIFTQDDITLLRKRMVAEIMKGQLGVE